MEKGKLGVYQLMITSKYFNDFDDFKHLQFATPKAKEIMAMFHFNPIPLIKESRKYFSQLETLHVYNKGDEEFRNEHFYKRIIHYEIDYEDCLKKETRR